ncbi:oxidoreductase [Actinobacteria bacterium YIM 96077]|uniref:Oxidoreductase n=1 Tax=Phytoactinopolyspora halophila TaxID=1981511 RepID=A0A329QZR7_9ACTN|nr:oxidoreductase [Phytoactinopolyspora halophila]AYY11753.1 oxidoreductase [Actinobacteria bacterium YIM 96077]RAW17811.1 oxidoreductase [Phytoactinopolyspora halophila]
MNDPFAGVAALHGVASAAAYARDAIDAVLQHPALRRDAAACAADSALRGARASAVLAGGDPDEVADPYLQGALRATGDTVELAKKWEGSPGQVLARLHVLVARDLVSDADALGRPVPDADSARLDQLMRLAVAPTAAPGVVVAAIVHGELAVMRPFGSADALLARAAERMVLVARGVDIKAVGVPEAGHLALKSAYEPLLEAYAGGTPDGVGAWLRHCAEAYARGADEALAVLDAR